MSRVAIATFERRPDWTDGDRLFVDALPPGVSAEAHPWSDPAVDWAAFDGVVLRSTWDYHLRRREFLDWLDQLGHLGVRAWNSSRLVRWNSDKVYLRDLERRGHAVAPTRWVSPGEATSLAEIVAATGWSDLVVKPSVSASAHETWRVHGAPAEGDETRFRALAGDHTLLVQPFLPEVVDPGEWSILFASGRYSHSVLKRPVSGDFRVQKEFGGSTVAAEPPPPLLESAQRLVADLPEVPLYARVDGIERDRSFLLLELELIEPDLFLEFSADAPRALAEALVDLLGT